MNHDFAHCKGDNCRIRIRCYRNALTYDINRLSDDERLGITYVQPIYNSKTGYCPLFINRKHIEKKKK
jgi:hypothetical protein